MMRKGLLLILLSAWSATGSPAHAFPVHEVRGEGAPSELWDQMKGISGILPGDEYEKVRVDHAIEKMRELLISKGYPQGDVSVEITGKGEARGLRFVVKPGPALRIAGVAFSTEDEGLTPELEQRLLKAADPKPGEVFDRDRIKDMKRAVEVALTSQSFVDSRVKEIGTESNPSGAKLIFRLELGQKISFSIQGNQYFSRSELADLVEKQRVLGLGRDYVAVLSGRIRDLYLERGFRKTRITPYVFEARDGQSKKILFEIDEGDQSRISAVLFDGNEIFTDDALESLYFKMASDRIRARIFNAKMVESAAASLIEELKKRGYLSARLIAIKSEEGSDGKSMRVRIFLSEGVQTRVQSIDFRGNRSLPTPELERILGVSEGDPLDTGKLEDGIEKIKKEFRNLGLLQFRITNESETGNSIVSYSEKNQFAYIALEMEEGPVLRLGGLEIYGIDATKRKVIEREVVIQVGDPLAEKKLLEVEERLRRLGIFSQVNLELKDREGELDRKTLKITVQETTPGNSTAGIGFRNDLGIRAFGGVSYSNLWGLDHTWSLDLTANRRLTNFRFVEYTAQTGYTLPWIFAGETTLRPGVSAEKRQYVEFDAETFAFTTSLERMLYRPWRISGTLGYTLERIRQFNAVDSTQDQQITIGSITPTIKVDLRDNPLSPRKGFYGMASFEYADQFLGTQSIPVPVRYGRFQVRSDAYLNLFSDVVWYGSVRGGWLKNLVDPHRPDGSIDSQVSVPLIKQFALGGVNSIRGFTEQEINVQANDPEARVQGYLTYVNYRTELDFYPTTSVAIGPFLDAGNLQRDDFSLGNLRFGSGIGLRYVTPVGPVNFDWGFKLFPRPGEATNVFYFSLGVI